MTVKNVGWCLRCDWVAVLDLNFRTMPPVSMQTIYQWNERFAITLINQKCKRALINAQRSPISTLIIKERSLYRVWRVYAKQTLILRKLSEAENGTSNCSSLPIQINLICIHLGVCRLSNRVSATNSPPWSLVNVRGFHCSFRPFIRPFFRACGFLLLQFYRFFHYQRCSGRQPTCAWRLSHYTGRFLIIDDLSNLT